MKAITSTQELKYSDLTTQNSFNSHLEAILVVW